MDASKKSSSLILRFAEPDGDRSVVLEDDGRVAYAYLLEGDDIVGDVWLYNVSAAPEAVDWRDANAMPFLNPARFCKIDQGLPRLELDSAIHCHWTEAGVDIFLGEIHIARLERGAHPGWSVLASCPGPLSRPLAAAMVTEFR